MKSLHPIITFLILLVAPLARAETKPAPAAADRASFQAGKEHTTVDLRSLLEKGRASASWPEGLVVRVSACLGEADGQAADEAAPDELREMWEFTASHIHRVEFEYRKDKSLYHRVESRAFDSKGLCKDLLDGKVIEIDAEKGEGPEIGFVGTHYHRGSRNIEVLWQGETLLDLLETNGPFLQLYRESDARAFGGLYARLASQARSLFQPKPAQSR